MINNEISKRLAQLSIPPETNTQKYEQWIEQHNFCQFLLDSQRGEVPLYVSHMHNYLYSLFLPLNALKGDYIDDLINWDVMPEHSWSYDYTVGKRRKPTKVTVRYPFDYGRTKVLKGATPITFSRYFEGKKANNNYIEINQFITHMHGLHWDESLSAFCRLDGDGNIDQAMKIYSSEEGFLVTAKADIIDFHQFLTKTVLIRLFDRMVCRDWKSFSGWTKQELSIHQDKKNKIFYKMGLMREESGIMFASYIRGFQIVRNGSSHKEMMARLQGESPEPKKYAKFIALDWKNKKVAEVSCDPKKLGNYFVKSDKPFEISPVFFKPEVLLKYKADPDKYIVTERHISCRGTWSLETYDINKEGQVHTYLVYLCRLPYLEQLYWKSFNEKPKGYISERAFKTDFQGNFDLSYDPLSSLKALLKKMQEDKGSLWRCGDDDFYRRLNYPVTDAEKEWVDEIHTLDKLVIEGLQYPYLKSLATTSGCFDMKHGSIRMLESILAKKGISVEIIEGVIEPFHEIRFLRTKFAGHRSGGEADKIKKELIRKYGSLKKHFRVLLQRTDQAVQTLSVLRF